MTDLAGSSDSLFFVYSIIRVLVLFTSRQNTKVLPLWISLFSYLLTEVQGKIHRVFHQRKLLESQTLT